METQEEILSFLDFLDLDEEIIDTRLTYLMVRSNYSTKHLTSVIQLLLYKNLINSQENTECNNEDEFDFTVKLLGALNSDNVDKICKIVNLVLSLNKTNIVSKSEHLLQQILSNIDCRSETSSINTVVNEEILINLKVCDSILDATIKSNVKVSLLFLKSRLEKIIDLGDDKVKIHFLINTVPRLFEGVIGYNILDRIWTYIKEFKNNKIVDALKIVSSLSDYYLPTLDMNGENKYVSGIIFQYDLWDMILFGLESHDSAVRKLAVYLLKRAMDCVIVSKRNIKIQWETQTIFIWETNNMKLLKSMWDNYFVLLDSLEEKQSNIVLPSLKLFESIEIGENWLNRAYNIGIRHDNTQIRLKCVEYRLRNAIRCETDAVTVLEALNDINLYNQRAYYDVLMDLSKSLKDDESFTIMIKAILLIKWSPIPLYHLSNVLANLKQNYIFNPNVTEILKVPCNNIAIRRAVNTNIIHFIKSCCQNLNWRDVLNIFSIDDLQRQKNDNDVNLLIKDISLEKDEKQEFYSTLTSCYKSVDYLLTYLSSHEDDIDMLVDIVNEKIKTLQNVVNRQYSDKKECLHDATFLIHLLIKTTDEDNRISEVLIELIARENKPIVMYIQSLLSNDISLTIEEMTALVGYFNAFGDDLKDILLQLYKTCVMLLNYTNNLDKTVLSALIIKAIMKNDVMITHYSHEMLDVKRFIKIMDNLKFGDFQNQSVGRLKNVLYETACEILHILIIEDTSHIHDDIKGVIDFVENVLESGGYGCLRLVLKIVNKAVKPLLNETTKFDMVKLINRTWSEIEELKSNNQYTPCIQEFINLITQDEILQKSVFNNIVMLYCNKILEYGPVKNYPLHYLITVLHSKNIKDHGHLIYVLCEILLYCPVPRKDQRIADNVTLEIIRDPKFGINEKDVDIHFNFEIQNLAVGTLTKIDEAETLNIISSFIIKKINDTFKTKQRYHGNSQLHKVLLIALQHLLILLLKSRRYLEEAFDWSFKMLVKLPHQPSVRICLEWYISLNLYIQQAVLNDQMLQILKKNNVPLTSQLFIMYWILKHKIRNNTYTNDEYEFVIDFLLSHTMGQLFNVRLHAQYLATKLYNIAKPAPKYAYNIDIIERTFKENWNDKNFVKLSNDYLANEFDIIQNLSPYFIYYVLPRYCGDSYGEEVNMDCDNCIANIDFNLRIDHDADDFKKEWVAYCKSDEKFVNIEINKDVHVKKLQDTETSGPIQKKYIPWKNMSDVITFDIGKKRESSSELIVVASLIDKLPNLGGMARTSEVFGVQTYVVDNLRHLQDKQFQGLSVSAERWINMEEVRPDRSLKEYLIKKKAEGYTVVAAEQTSTSCTLQNFKFPKKSLLMLGHEKEGIPCDLLPMMDHCVEIPQQGYIRSLNVHVTAAIFVWEYARQNIL